MKFISRASKRVKTKTTRRILKEWTGQPSRMKSPKKKKNII